MELEGAFSTEAACRDYLARLRWPEGFRCPHCGGSKSWPVRGVLFQCAECGRQTSVTAGTIFQDTRTPLPVWFRAMWWVTTQKNGASALGLQRVLGLKSYETAWAWLHKLRRAMVRPGRDMLTGRVEVDECYVGGPEDGLVGRLNLDKALVVVAAQEDGAGIGRIRLRQIADASPIACPLCAGVGGVRKHRAYGRMAGISAAEELRIQARGDVPEGEREERVGAAAARSSGDLAPETVDAGNPSGGDQP